MCQHHAPPRPASRAIALEHGPAHDRDHARWSRRSFLASAAAAGSAFVLHGLPVRAAAPSGLLARLAMLPTDRILVLVQLAGGNDGLNTVVPVTNDLYYGRRPTIAVPPSGTFALGSDYGLHGAMGGLQPLWGTGEMAVVHAVGYPDHDLSHFRSTDIWASASPSNQMWNDGWTGRWLDHEYPDYVSAPPDYPVAVRIGGASALLLRGSATTMGMSFSDAAQLDQLAATGQFYDEADVPPTAHGTELAFVRSVYNASFRYRDSLVAASDAGTNGVEYPNSELARSLAAVARLVRGGLPARLYVVQHGGFDTHSEQTDRQPELLAALADAIAAFQADLADGGRAEGVLTMTFSEFGRRVEENGSGGTDHGTAAPLFLVGGGVAGGLFGGGPDLSDLDPNGNLRHTTDFRAIYATVLQHWFGLPSADTADVLGGTFEPLGFVANPVATEPSKSAARFVLEGARPNPFGERATVAFALDRPGLIRLALYDAVGRKVATLADGPRSAGRHEVALDGRQLPGGTYLLVLDTVRGRLTRPVVRVR